MQFKNDKHTLTGTYDVPEFGIEGGVPTIVPGTTTLDDLADYGCVATLTIGAAGNGSVDLSEIEEKIAALGAAVEELKKADTKNAEDLAQAILDLTVLIEAAEKAAEDADAALKADLEGHLAEAKDALTEAINTVQDNLDAAVEELKALIDTKADITTLNEKVAELNAAIEKCETVSKAYADAQDLALGEVLLGSIATTKTEAIIAADEALKAADDELKAQDTALKNSVDSVKATIDSVKSELTDLINRGDKAKADALAEEVAKLREEMEQAKKDAQLVPIIIAVIAVIGNIALAVWLIIIKRKKSV